MARMDDAGVIEQEGLLAAEVSLTACAQPWHVI
jgi:hypothetical protein